MQQTMNAQFCGLVAGKLRPQAATLHLAASLNDSSLKEQLLKIALVSSPHCGAPKYYVRSSLRSPLRRRDSLFSFITISSQLIYMAAYSYLKAARALQLGLESTACSSLVFPSQRQPWLGRPLSTLSSFELCYSISPSRNEFPISFAVCSASIPTRITMLISVCHQALQSWRCV